MRTLHLIDLENMVCQSEFSRRDAAIARQRVRAAAPVADGDQTVVAVSHHNGAAACFGWNEKVQFLMRSGQDGADLALLGHVQDIEWVAERFQRVVIASGDNAFALTARALKAAGLEVLAISPDDGFSNVLRRALDGAVLPLGPQYPRHSLTLLTAAKDAA